MNRKLLVLREFRQYEFFREADDQLSPCINKGKQIVASQLQSALCTSVLMDRKSPVCEVFLVSSR